MGNYGQAALIPWQLSICLQHGEETGVHSSAETTWAFLTEMEQPIAESPTSPTREERELQASHPYGTPLVELKQMLDGDIQQDKMTCLFFVKESIRKLCDLNTGIGNNTQFILIGGTLIERTSSFEQKLGPWIRYESVECDPVQWDKWQYLSRYCH